MAARPHRRDRWAQHVEKGIHAADIEDATGVVVHCRHKAVHCGGDVLARGVVCRWSDLDGFLNTDMRPALMFKVAEFGSQTVQISGKYSSELP